MNISIRDIYDTALKRKVQQKVTKTPKPSGALGVLGDIALRVALIQKTESPQLRRPTIVVFVGDNGIAESLGIENPFEETYQNVVKFFGEEAAVNVCAKVNSVKLKLLDVGAVSSFEDNINYWMHAGTSFIDKKIALGTQSFLDKPAMQTAQCEAAMQIGAERVKAEKRQGSNVIGFGAMGASTAFSAVVLSAALLDTDLQDFIHHSQLGGLDSNHAYQVLEKGYRKHPKSHDPKTILTVFGGFELAAMVGAYLQAANKNMTILVDDFAATAALLCASQINPKVLDYCVFSHESSEPGHKIILKQLRAKPLLNGSVSLESGCGAAMSFPLVKTAVQLLGSELG